MLWPEMRREHMQVLRKRRPIVYLSDRPPQMQSRPWQLGV
jgi:hypothetical protein